MSTLVFTGNLAEDPQLAYTPSGVPVANLRVIENRKVKQGDQWVDAEPTAHRVKVWRSAAENVAATLTKGTNVVVVGSLRTEKYEKNGETRYSQTVVAEVVGVSLQYQTAKGVERAHKAQADEPAAQAPAAGDPFEGPQF